MFTTNHAYSTVTAILPPSSANRVVDAITETSGTSALAWKARGSLLNDHWYQQWLPPISPSRQMLHLLVPDTEVQGVVSTIIEVGKIHQQATGAVFSSPCDHVYLGSNYHAWPTKQAPYKTGMQHELDTQLSIIYCVVGHQYSDRVTHAAVSAGAHGPIVHYTEGRGLRDRLGWLRITKEHEKEVLMVIADQADVEEVFDAMASAGQLHLPGHGFMYRLSINTGMYNLPSRVSHHHYAANMQQVITAIDHLAGHTHWRDQDVVDVGADGKSVGLAHLTSSKMTLQDQVCLSSIVDRDHLQELMDIMLDAGAPGLNINHARFVAHIDGCQAAGARINQEYSLVRCVTDQFTAERVCAAIDTSAESAQITNMCVLVQAVPRVATYVPTTIDYRKMQQRPNSEQIQRR